MVKGEIVFENIAIRMCVFDDINCKQNISSKFQVN